MTSRERIEAALSHWTPDRTPIFEYVLLPPLADLFLGRPHVGDAGRFAAWAVNASDGNLWPVIGDFLLGCEVDAYLEIDQHAGMELAPLKAAYGDRITFFGNLDCGNTLSFATPQEISRVTLACLEAGQGNGGHIFCVSNAVTASVPAVNYRAMVNAYREYCQVPAL